MQKNENRRLIALIFPLAKDIIASAAPIIRHNKGGIVYNEKPGNILLSNFNHNLFIKFWHS